MTPAPRYDQRWQIEHRIAELVGEKKTVEFQIQRCNSQLHQLEQEIFLLRSNLSEIVPQGEPS